MTPRRPSPSPWRALAGSLSLMFLAAHPASAADWPQWRGPARDGHAAAGTAAPTSLPKELQPAWRSTIGGGHSSPIVAGGRVIYLDEQNGREIAHAVDLATGKEIWRADYAESFKDEWGAGPRSTPIADGDHVYVQACNGDFRCLRLKDGSTVWQTSFEKDFGVKFLGSKANEGTAARRGNNGSGVIDGHRLILPVGQTNGASLVCFDKLTGKVLWKTGRDEAAYSSLMTGSPGGVRQVIALTADALLGAELESGRILWRVPLKTAAKRHAASPVLAGNRITVNSHTFGLACFEIQADTAGLRAVKAWENKDLKINLATPVAVDGHLYVQGANRDYVCVDLKSGTQLWSEPGFGAGKKDYASTIVAGSSLLVLTEDGQLLLLKADPAKYHELARLQVCGSTWSHPAFADGHLVVRDGRQLFCVKL